MGISLESTRGMVFGGDGLWSGKVFGTVAVREDAMFGSVTVLIWKLRISLSQVSSGEKDRVVNQNDVYSV